MYTMIDSELNAYSQALNLSYPLHIYTLNKSSK